MAEMTISYKIIVGKLEGKKPHGRSKHRWEDNIKIHLKKQDIRMWTGLIWLRTTSNIGLLWTR